MDFSPRRVLLFLIASALVLIGWNFFVLKPYQKAQEKAALEKRLAEDEEKGKSKKGDASKTDEPKKGSRIDSPPAIAEKPNQKPEANGEKVVKAEPEKQLDKPKNPKKEQTAILGSLDPKSGYFFQATLTTTGAAVSSLELNDPRYHDLEDKEAPLSLLETVPKPDDAPGPGEKYYRTFATSFPELDKYLKNDGIHLDTVNWSISQPAKPEPNQVTFEYIIPGKFRLTKEYSINPKLEGVVTQEQRDTEYQGYFLKLTLGIENLQDKAEEVSYQLQGPVGMPLEDRESTSKFRDIKIGAVDEQGDVSHETLTVKDLAEMVEDGDDVEQWASAYRYVGVDGQFFATLLYNPPDNPPTTEQLANYIPEITLNEKQPAHSEVTILLESRTTELEPGGKLTNEYTLYAGPKRQTLLTEMEAGDIIELGWFGWISKGLLAILAFLHNNLSLPYGLAIICLTIMVRGAVFPLSKKQANSAAAMKDLQPRLKELKAKYGDDKQKFAEAQMKLFRESGVNPLASCLPMVLQLPIYIGLYGAIRHAIDLRAATFLWVDNLAAPDHLFELPFRVWWVGQYFNLLPILTVVLFIAQQKMFMPEPDPDDEQAVMQQKMMKFMMIFMGFLFYHMPAGLCIYFIASSLWGMGERKLLDRGKKKTETPDENDSASATKLATTSFKTGNQNGREKRGNTASQKRGKKSSKSRR